MPTQCRICDVLADHPIHDAKEMMYGLKDSHRYFQCQGCGCLQIQDLPESMARYYEGGYYSFQRRESRGLRGMIAARRNRFAVLQSGLLGKALFSRWPTGTFDFLGSARTGLTLESHILDVGCGAGTLVQTFREAGFVHARGIDPFVESDILLEGRPLVTRTDLAQVTETFDLVMFHHSLEHMPDQVAALKMAFARLCAGGHCIVRVPTVSSEAWGRYGVNWVQLDAPRHFYLHSLNSMQRVAKEAGFDGVSIEFDSTAFQFWGSEQYARGITLRDPRSYAVNPSASVFTADDMARFDIDAARVNGDRLGDQVVFVLRRPG